MINRFIHALRNRRGVFNEPLFVLDPTFVPAVLTREANFLRQQLFLHVDATDYYLKAYACALAAYPDIEQLTEDTVRSYHVKDFPPRGVEISGAEFLSKANGFGCYTDSVPVTLPVNLNYRVTYFQPGTLTLLAVQSGLVERVPYWLSGSDPNKVMRLEWPSDFPFEGPLELRQHWVPGSTIEIEVQPSRFPYEMMAKKISSNAYLMRLLTSANLVDEFLAVPDPHRKIAIATALLAKDNPSVYG